eukprot:GEMP01093164.1.p1 GENE.GEMP01093164.1~~GEMP01093164.1.p1  ORF type:complete len:122 (+),score=39.99 GEMP01093164.1:273-638(+)
MVKPIAADFGDIHWPTFSDTSATDELPTKQDFPPMKEDAEGEIDAEPFINNWHGVGRFFRDCSIAVAVVAPCCACGRMAASKLGRKVSRKADKVAAAYPSEQRSRSTSEDEDSGDDDSSAE